MDMFITAFWVLVVICFVLFVITNQAFKTNLDGNAHYFQRVYLIVYTLAMGEYKNKSKTHVHKSEESQSTVPGDVRHA